MRQFVILGHQVPIDADFSLDDLPGQGGRIDVLCRCVNAAFLLSHGLREDVRAYLVLRDRVTVRLEGPELRYLAPDERNIGSLLREALEAAGEAVGHQEVESTPGIYASRRGLEAVLEALRGDARRARGGPGDAAADRVIQLHVEGRPVTELNVPDDPAFVLSDHEPFTDRESDILEEAADERIRLGPKSLHANQAITIAHNVLDTDGFERY